MKLKTLKELKCSSANPMFNIGADTQWDVLKKEAIKWVKELIDNKPKNISPIRMVGKNRLQQLEFTITWIKKFFDISEEDLK